MTRVLFFVEGLSRGGIETFVMNLLGAIDSAKIVPSILALKEHKQGEDAYFVKQAMVSNIPVAFLLNKEYEPSHNQAKRYFAYTSRFKEYLRRNKNNFDIIHIQASNLVNMMPYIRLILRETPWRVILHSHNSGEESKKIRLLQGILRSRLPRERIKLLACSEPAGKWMFGNRDYELVNNGIALSKFSYSSEIRKSIRSKWGIGEQEKLLVHIGRFATVKNHSFLLKVFKSFHTSVPGSKLFLIGDGELREEIVNQIKQLNLEGAVVLMGTRTDVQELVSAMDCLVFPSVSEGLSVALVEAQANGIPVVAANTIAPETKMSSLFEMLDIADTEDNIARWVSCIENFARIGRDGNFKFPQLQEYDIRSVARRMEELYEMEQQNAYRE